MATVFNRLKNTKAPHIASLADRDIAQAVQVLRSSFVESYVALAPESRELIETYAEFEITAASLRGVIDSDSAHCLVLTTGDVVAGVMELTSDNPPADQESRCMRVHRLYIARDFTGQGHGRDLLAHAEQLARDQGCQKLWLSVWDLNTAAIGFYEKQGFKRNGHIPWDYETDDDARHDLDIVFEKSLV